MQKFMVHVHQVRDAYFYTEANDVKEAEQLFVEKMKNDDYFVDDVYEVLENGTTDEEITAQPVEYDGTPDYTYEYMTKKNEEDE